MRISDWSSDVCSSDLTSFGLALDLDTIEMLKETDPDTYWQSAHYEGWPAVLVRYDSSDPERVRAMIERSREWTAAKPKVRQIGRAHVLNVTNAHLVCSLLLEKKHNNNAYHTPNL